MLLILIACSEYGLQTPADVMPEGWEEDWGDAPTDGAAQIQVLPEDFSFGTVSVDCGNGELEFFIRNIGNEDLELDAVLLEGADAEIWISTPAVPAVLVPGEILQGLLRYMPHQEGQPPGTVVVLSSDPDAPTIERVLTGEACADIDSDSLCDEIDDDIDGDGILNDDDPWPRHHVIDDIHIDFDDLSAGTRVSEQYADEGVHFSGSGSPGEGYDSNVISAAADATTATVDTLPNVLITYVNNGFNYSGDPGLSGSLDEPADVIRLRLYNAGIPFAKTVDGEIDQGELEAYDADGQLIGTHAAIASTDDGEEYVDLEIVGSELVRFDLFTGDFDAVDDLRILRLEEPVCGD